ncbi:MAG TPA: HAD family hydrolase [Candidatus Baltobacteraceae bacterium]|nr:HAD family hydrolase [Candidatus Baltobacteraceae bacterium]
MQRAMIFDIGGVLVDTSHAIAEGYRRGFAANGIGFPFTADQVRHLRGIGKYNDHREAIRALAAISISGASIDAILWQDTAESIIDAVIQNTISGEAEATLDKAAEAFNGFYKSGAAVPFLKEFPGTRECLHKLSERGYRLGVVSNSDRAWASVMLEPIGEPLFSVVLTADDVEAPKPSPSGIKQAMAVLDADPRYTYYIGDSVKDIRASRGAGCSAVILLTGHGTKDRISKEGPDLVFGSFAELAEHFLKV